MLGEGELDSTEIASESLPAGKLRWSSVESTIASNCVCFNNVASSPVARLNVCSQRTNWTELNCRSRTQPRIGLRVFIAEQHRPSCRPRRDDQWRTRRGESCKRFDLLQPSSGQFSSVHVLRTNLNSDSTLSAKVASDGRYRMPVRHTELCFFSVKNKTNHVISERWQKSDPMTDLTAVTSTLDKSTD